MTPLEFQQNLQGHDNRREQVVIELTFGSGYVLICRNLRPMFGIRKLRFTDQNGRVRYASIVGSDINYTSGIGDLVEGDRDLGGIVSVRAWFEPVTAEVATQ